LVVNDGLPSIKGPVMYEGTPVAETYTQLFEY